MYVIGLLLLCLHPCLGARVLVNCTWPCADPQQVCVLSSTSIQCATEYNSQWILPSAVDSPLFVGEVARWHTPCVTPPTPPLSHNFSAIDTVHQSIIDWPPSGDLDHPLDDYLSDCELTTYCALDARICVDRIATGGTCQSTNQCSTPNYCIQNKCTPVNANATTGGPVAGTAESSTSHAGAIAGGIIGGVASVAIFGGLCLYRRWLLNRSTTLPSASSQIACAPQHVTPLQTIIPADIVTHTTPSMQQQHLQNQMQSQRWQDDDEDKPNINPNHPPPPYSP